MNAGKVVWLPALVFFINLAGLGLLAAYSQLNLRPDLSAIRGPDPQRFRRNLSSGVEAWEVSC